MSCYSRTAYLDTAHLCVVSVCVCMCALFAKKAQPHRGCHSTAGYRLGSIFKPFFFLPLWSIEIDSSWISNPKQTTTDAVLSAIYDLADLIPVWSCLL